MVKDTNPVVQPRVLVLSLDADGCIINPVYVAMVNEALYKNAIAKLEESGQSYQSSAICAFEDPLLDDHNKIFQAFLRYLEQKNLGDDVTKFLERRVRGLLPSSNEGLEKVKHVLIRELILLELSQANFQVGVDKAAFESIQEEKTKVLELYLDGEFQHAMRGIEISLEVLQTCLLQANQNLLNAVINVADNYDKIVLMIGSNRQTPEYEYKNAEARKLGPSLGFERPPGYFFPLFFLLRDHLDEKLGSEKVVTSPLLLADIATNSAPGTFIQITMERFQKKDWKIKDNIPSWIDDTKKAVLVFLQSNLIVDYAKGSKIDYCLVDDREDILGALETYYKAHNKYLHKDVCLKLTPYTGDNVIDLTVPGIKGTGQYNPDHNFVGDAKAMAESAPTFRQTEGKQTDVAGDYVKSLKKPNPKPTLEELPIRSARRISISKSKSSERSSKKWLGTALFLGLLFGGATAIAGTVLCLMGVFSPVTFLVVAGWAALAYPMVVNISISVAIGAVVAAATACAVGVMAGISRAMSAIRNKKTDMRYTALEEESGVQVRVPVDVMSLGKTSTKSDELKEPDLTGYIQKGSLQISDDLEQKSPQNIGFSAPDLDFVSNYKT